METERVSVESGTHQDRIGLVLLGKYHLVRLLGAGGMGQVYEAQNVAVGKSVAIKFLHGGWALDEAALARFREEARALCVVRSDHVVDVFDWGHDERGEPFLVMELLAGQDLAARLSQGRRLPVDEVLRLAVELLRGMRKVHQAGIVHRDLKPQNIFLVTGDDDLEHVKILDFGLSNVREFEPQTGAGPSEKEARQVLSSEAIVAGTPSYMAPEQFEALVAVDRRADIWAFGTVLYEMLAGFPPFVERSYARLVTAICQRDPASLIDENPAVCSELQSIVLRALRRAPEERWSSVDEILLALEDLPKVRDASRFKVVSLHAIESVPESAGVDSNPSLALPTPAVRLVAEGLESQVGPLDATIASRTRGAATMWLTAAPVFSLWRGEVDAPDRLRIETRDGSVRDLRLEPVGTLNLGRAPQVGDQKNELVYPDVASRLAVRLEHDGVRWWLLRREECSVPVQVGERVLQRGEKAPLVHGTFVTVGGMRASFVDRRYVARAVSAGIVDTASGLLARVALEQEVATALQQGGPAGLVLFAMGAVHGQIASATSVAAVVRLHRLWPQDVVARSDDVIACLVRGDANSFVERARAGVEALLAEGLTIVAVGTWQLQGDAANAGREVELALNAVEAAGGPGANVRDVIDLRLRQERFRLGTASQLIERATSPKQQMLLFAIEEQNALAQIGRQVVGALEQELAAVIVTLVGPGATLSRLAPGIIGASVSRKLDATQLGVQVQCEWHARSPVTDGKLELPRSVSWEGVAVELALVRAEELSRECNDAHGVLSALSGGLPYPIAGRVYAAIAASSSVERIKMLFDVLEGAWRFIAIVLGAAYFAKGGEGDHAAIRAFYEKHATRTGLPLGAWRELARLAVNGFEGIDDPIGRLARQVLDVTLGQNQTFDALSNLMHAERNSFAHGHYNEARATADLPEFEQMTRVFLRALRPLCNWTLVTVQRTEPDLFGDSQTVEFIDHTGPHATGARRRLGFASPLRLANVVYLARWRDGLVLPLEPFLRRMAHEDQFELFWMDHLPRAGSCNMGGVVSGEALQSVCDPRRLPPLLRELAT